MPRKKSTKITHSKLGQFRAEGLAYKEERRIVIDERLKGSDYLLVLIHELSHIHLPDLTEEAITKFAEAITEDILKTKKIVIVD